jgi:hypothetical protein
MAPLTGSLHATGNASKTGQGKRRLKNGECAQVRMPGQCVSAVILADREFLKIGEEKLAKKKKRPQASCSGLVGTGIAGDAEQYHGIIDRQDYRTGEKGAAFI